MDERRLVEEIEALSEEHEPSPILAAKVQHSVLLVSVVKAVLRFYVNVFTLLTGANEKTTSDGSDEDHEDHNGPVDRSNPT